MNLSSFKLFHIGIIVMFVFGFCSLVLNIVSIATTAWVEPWFTKSIWMGCNINGQGREPCFKIVPPVLIGIGTGFNALSFVVLAVTQVSHFVSSLRKKLASILVLVAEVTTCLSLIFNTIGWYFVFFGSYQNFESLTYAGDNAIVLAPRVGWSFWLMTPSFFLSILAAITGAAILGCKCAFIYNQRFMKPTTVSHPVPRHIPREQESSFETTHF